MAKRARKEKEKSQLEAALEFVKLIASGNEISDGYCRLYDGRVYYNNRVISGGHPTGLDYSACPQIDKLLRAVKDMPTNTTVTFDRDRIKIKYGRKEYAVPCIDGGLLPWAPITELQFEADDRFVEALVTAALPTKEGAQRVIEASVLVRPYTAVGTDGKYMVEAFHGVPFPVELCVPTVFVQTLKRIKKPVARVGYSDVALTVQFEDESWITTQLYVEPTGVTGAKIDGILDGIQATDLTVDFATGVIEAFEFDKEADARISGDKITVGEAGHDSFAYEFDRPVQINNFACPVAQLHKVIGIIEKVDASECPRRLRFTGDKCRGAIMGIVERASHDTTPYVPPPLPPTPPHIADDEVPF
jgi:hypothetical protein